MAVFTIISRNDSTKLLFLQLFIDLLSVAVRGGGSQTLLCCEDQRLLLPGGGRGGLGSRRTPPPIPGPRRPCPSQAPRAALTTAAADAAPPPGTALPVTLRTLGFGFPGGRRLRAVNLRSHLRAKKESQPGRPTRTRSSPLCVARRGQLRPGHPGGSLRADKAGYPSPFSLAGKRPAQPRPRESHDHPLFSHWGGPPPASGPIGAEPLDRGRGPGAPALRGPWCFGAERSRTLFRDPFRCY